MILCVYGSRRNANKYQPLGILSGLIASKQITITEAMLHNNWLTNRSKTHNTSEPGNEAYFRSNSKLNYFEVLDYRSKYFKVVLKYLDPQCSKQ